MTKEETKALEKQRSFYLKLVAACFLIGLALCGVAALTGISILGIIGDICLAGTIVFFVLAYKTGKKLLG